MLPCCVSWVWSRPVLSLWRYWVSALSSVRIENVFLQEVDDVARPRRQLLQEEEGEPGEVQEEIVEEVTTTTTTTTEEPFDAADQAGPTRFYREYGNLPKFLMEVDNGNKELYTLILLTIV